MVTRVVLVHARRDTKVSFVPVAGWICPREGEIVEVVQQPLWPGGTPTPLIVSGVYHLFNLTDNTQVITIELETFRRGTAPETEAKPTRGRPRTKEKA